MIPHIDKNTVMTMNAAPLRRPLRWVGMMNIVMVASVVSTTSSHLSSGSSNPWFNEKSQTTLLFERPEPQPESPRVESSAHQRRHRRKPKRQCCDGHIDASSIMKGSGGNRRACNFFIWDAPSAVLYRWCHHLMKDNVYEGRGGKKFVRYEANSMLQLLYPCSRYSPNKCFVCGGGFPDHLRLWWSKRHLYSPYDLYMDKTYNEALVLHDNDEETKRKPKPRQPKRTTNKIVRRSPTLTKNAKKLTVQSPPTPTIHRAPTFAFHRRYAKDISHWIGADPRELRKEVRDISWFQDGTVVIRGVQSDTDAVLSAYAVPDIDKNIEHPSTTLRLLRQICLGKLDALLVLQEAENRKNQR